MPISTLLPFISTHETLVKIVIGCTIPLVVALAFLSCYLSRTLSRPRKPVEDVELKGDSSGCPAHIIDEKPLDNLFLEPDISGFATKFTFPAAPARSYLPRRAHISVSDPHPSRASLSWWHAVDLTVDSHSPPQSPTRRLTARNNSSRPDPAPLLFNLKKKSRPNTPPSCLPSPPVTPPLCIVKKNSTVSVSPSKRATRLLEDEKENINFETSGRIMVGLQAKVKSLRASSPKKNRAPLFERTQPDSWDIFKNRAAVRKQLGLPCLKVDGEDSLEAIVE